MHPLLSYSLKKKGLTLMFYNLREFSIIFVVVISLPAPSVLHPNFYPFCPKNVVLEERERLILRFCTKFCIFIFLSIMHPFLLSHGFYISLA